MVFHNETLGVGQAFGWIITVIVGDDSDGATVDPPLFVDVLDVAHVASESLNTEVAGMALQGQGGPECDLVVGDPRSGLSRHVGDVGALAGQKYAKDDQNLTQKNEASSPLPWHSAVSGELVPAETSASAQSLPASHEEHESAAGKTSNGRSEFFHFPLLPVTRGLNGSEQHETL